MSKTDRPDGDAIKAAQERCARRGDYETVALLTTLATSQPARDAAEKMREAAIRVIETLDVPIHKPTMDGTLVKLEKTRELMAAAVREIPGCDGAEGAGLGQDGKPQERVDPSRPIAARSTNSAPPKPAPDAVREALRAAKAAMIRTRTASIAGCEEGYGNPQLWADELFASHGDLTKAIALCADAEAAPVPPADGALEQLIAAQHCIARETTRTIRLEQTIRDTIEALERNSTSAPVVECLKAALSPSGARPAEHRWLNDLIKAAEAFRAAMVSSNVVGRYHKELRALEAALDPLNYRSEAGAGEPVAWGRVIDGKAVTVSRERTQANDEPLYATPPVRGDREAIIRLAEIHLGAWLKSSDPALQLIPTAARQDIRDFADAIVSLLAPPGADEREALLKYLDIFLHPNPQVDLSGLVCKHGLAIEACAARECRNPMAYETAISRARDYISRQAPPSSSEGGR